MSGRAGAWRTGARADRLGHGHCRCACSAACGTRVEAGITSLSRLTRRDNEVLERSASDIRRIERLTCNSQSTLMRPKQGGHRSHGSLYLYDKVRQPTSGCLHAINLSLSTDSKRVL